MFLDLAAVTTATTAAGSGWATAVVDLIVKGGALGLALMLTWMSYQLFKTLLAQPTVSKQKVMLVVFFVFGTFGSLVGGALMHRWLTHPRVEVTLLVSPELDRADDLPQIQAATVVPGPDPRKFRLAVAAGEQVTIEVTRLLNRAREAVRLQELVSRYERERAASNPEIGAEDAI